MFDINKEIDAVADQLEKSSANAAASYDMVKSIVLSLGKENLRKAVPTLSDDQKTLLKEVLEDMAKSHKELIANDKKVTLEPLSNSTKEGDYKLNEDEKPQFDARDEELAEEARKKDQMTQKHQGGGQPVEGWEGEVIKSASPAEKEPEAKTVETENKEGKAEDKQIKKLPDMKKAEEKSNEGADCAEGKQVMTPNLDDKKKLAKDNLKNMVARAQERKIEKSVAVPQLAKSLDLDEGKLSVIWDAMAKSTEASEKMNPEHGQVTPAPIMKEDKKVAKKEPMSGKAHETADEGEQAPKLAKGFWHEEAPVYFAKSEANPFATRTIKPNAAYTVDAAIAAEDLNQKARLSKSNFDYDNEGENLVKGFDPAQQDVAAQVNANAKKNNEKKKADKEEIKDINLKEKLTSIEERSGPKMPMLKSSPSEVLIERKLDMGSDSVTVAQANQAEGPKGAFLVKSFSDAELESLFESTDMWAEGKKAEATLEKANGEGSKGGKVVGHTKSGKPVYATSKHDSYLDFSSHDHEDAQHIHTFKGDDKRASSHKLNANLARQREANPKLAETYKNEVANYREKAGHKKEIANIKNEMANFQGKK